MGNNIQRLGETLAGRMKKTVGAAATITAELGIINSNLSLTTDSLKTPIPKGDYMIDITLSSNNYRTESTSHTHSGGNHTHSGGEHNHGNEEYTHNYGEHMHDGGSHTHSGGKHDHGLPAAFRGIKAGDRVLVLWCGNEPVVTAIVVGS